MGVYINIEMPKSCGNCFYDTHCDNWRLRNWGAPPPEDCPLVPVPPHGRWNNIIQGIIPSGQCSNCGAWDKVTRFCQNCGSQMEGAT